MGPRRLKNEKQELQKGNVTDVREAIIKKKKNFFFSELRKDLYCQLKGLNKFQTG